MKAEYLRKILKGKSQTISMRVNPELLKLVDESLKKDKDFRSRNELIEVLLLRYLEEKGKL
jgi:metal-responsive CopG/Arc/MetJ family transcriptional regulator